jgi:hypothetical protein
MIQRLLVALLALVGGGSPFFLDPDLAIEERLLDAREDAAARPALATVRALLDLDCDSTLELDVLQKDGVGSGLLEERDNVYRLGPNGFDPLWAGLRYGYVANLDGPLQEAAGTYRVASVCGEIPEIEQVLRDSTTGRQYRRSWRLHGDRFELLPSAS